MTKYNTDFYGWTQEQAALLKSGRFSEIDVEHLIEEVETMGRSEKRALESRLTVLLVHLLKWQYQPARRGNSSSTRSRSAAIPSLSLRKNAPRSKFSETLMRGKIRRPSGD